MSDSADRETVEHDDQPMLLFFLQGANYFSAYLSIWQCISPQMVLKFYDEGLTSQTSNKNATVFLYFKIFRERIIKYEFLGDSTDSIITSTSAKNLETKFRGSTKSINACVTMWEGDSNPYCNLTSTSQVQRSGTLIESSIPEDFKEYKLPTMPKEPLTVIVVSELIKALKDATGAHYFMMKPYRNGVHVGGINSSHQQISFSDLGDCSEPYVDTYKEENLRKLQTMFGNTKDTKTGIVKPSIMSIDSNNNEDDVFYILLSDIKKFSSLKNVSFDNDILKIYFISGFFKFVGNIASYGEHYFYFKCSRSIPSNVK